MKYSSTFKFNLIYIIRINDKEHKGCLKIGEATAENITDLGIKPNSKLLNVAAIKRVNSYTQTAGIKYELLHTEITAHGKNGKIEGFNDKEVHKVLERSGIIKKVFDIDGKANEWFVTDLETAKKAIKAVKDGKDSLTKSQITKGQNPIIFRPEQDDAIKKTVKHFNKKNNNDMLWFAKMRFGKTLSALEVVKRQKFKRTLIITHRPVVDGGWFEDFGKIFYDSPEYNYGSKGKGGTFSKLEQIAKKKKNEKYIYFASIHDLRGSAIVGGNFNKNDELLNNNWDFIIIDEAHEGTQTEIGKDLLNYVRKEETKVLHLSGTPYNLLDNYKEDQIFVWDYVMEQKAKRDWEINHPGDPNPYASLPQLNIYTFDLGKLLGSYTDAEVAFNFREFFRVKADGKFIHEKDVKSFLNLICKVDKSSNYPYSTDEYRDIIRHSLWMVPGVKEARALSSLLRSHPVFGQFNIVNVAGDGDEEEEEREALKKVEKAISDKPLDTYSITLSCGRLTTGVTVKAWTAVFMLSGNYNTSAAMYMQTIFRAQTPATIGGKVKENCFVFDFAPDRTLKVVAEAVTSGKKKGDEKIKIGEFLNFCPIIAKDGSRMTTYNVDRMLEELKKAYIERVVNTGFEDTHLYDKKGLLKLTKVDLEKFNSLQKIIGTTKAMPKTNKIDVNKQGMTKQEFEQIEEVKKKSKKELTAKEKKLLEKYKLEKKKRDTAISILRGISIRMPLMLYGADVTNEDKEINIDNFTKLVDTTSWKEFMPKGVTKEMFEGFKKYYDPDIFRAAGKRIRAMAKAADDLTVEDRIERITNIFSTFRNPDKETVLTPWRVVNMHLGDCLGGYSFLDKSRDYTISDPHYVSHGKVTDTVFSSNAKVLEINSKSGLYPLYVAYSIFRNITSKGTKKSINLSVEQQQGFWDKVVEENIFVISKTPMAKAITMRTLVGFRKATTNIQYVENIVEQITDEPEKFVKNVRNAKSFWKIKNGKTMNFDAIVGNPPYMEMDGGAQSSAKPIYNLFVDIARSLEPNFISLIMPTRWYSGGKGLDEFRESMINDKNLSLLHDFLNPDEVFPNTNIRGGICYFLWDKNYSNEIKLTEVVTHRNGDKPLSVNRSLKSKESDIFIRHNVALEILEKVNNFKDFKSFEDYVSPRKPFGLDGFIVNKKLFRNSHKGLNSPVICYGKKQEIGYLDRTEVKSRKKWIDLYKVFTPYANNIGTELNDDNLNAFIGKPGTICTESYIVLGADLRLDKVSSNNLCKYCTTRFTRFMHSIAKSSQHGTSKTYKFVPLQDFTSKSDIDWSKSVEEIDHQLYKKYKLSKDEIAFIEKMIKPMK